jgi:thioredoxin-related protein
MIATLRQRSFSLGGFLLVCLLSFVSTPPRAAPADAFFDASLGDFAAELKTARQQGKAGVLLVFEAESCPFCHRMREQVLSQPAVQQFYRRHFNIFPVDFLGSVAITDFAGKEHTEKEFARNLRVRGTPTFLFVSLDGKELARFSGVTRDVDEFMALGRYVAEGHHAHMSFEQFKSDGRVPRKLAP